MSGEIVDFFQTWKEEYQKRRDLFNDWADEIKWLALVAGYLFIHATKLDQQEALNLADENLQLKRVVNEIHNPN